MDEKIIQKAGKYFTETEKHRIIQEMLDCKYTKQEIWQKYTGQEEEHGQLLRWMQALGYNVGIKTRRPNFETKFQVMSKKKISKTSTHQEEENFEKLQLKKRISELEKQLRDAELKAIAFSTMVDIAEKEFKIPIRKKLNTKP